MNLQWVLWPCHACKTDYHSPPFCPALTLFLSLFFIVPRTFEEGEWYDAPFKVLILSILTRNGSTEEKLLGQDWGHNYSTELILILLGKGLTNSEGWISEHGVSLTMVLKYKELMIGDWEKTSREQNSRRLVVTNLLPKFPLYWGSVL